MRQSIGCPREDPIDAHYASLTGALTVGLHPLTDVVERLHVGIRHRLDDVVADLDVEADELLPLIRQVTNLRQLRLRSSHGLLPWLAPVSRWRAHGLIPEIRHLPHWQRPLPVPVRDE